VKGAYRVALFCGAVPLLLGTSVFALWLVTRAEWLMAVGAFVLFGGLACFGVGVLALARFCWVGLRGGDPPPRFWATTTLCAVVLLSNFPAAGLILRKVIAIETRYTVVVRNETAEPLVGVHVTGGGRVYAAFGEVAPGKSVTRAFRILDNGPLEIHSEGATSTIDGYVTRDESTFAMVTFGPDGTVSVHFASGDD